MPRTQRDHEITRLWLSARDTYDWAHRPGAAWPGSGLSGHRLYAEFHEGDLVDLTVDGKRPEDAPVDLVADEFDAMTSDFLRERFGPDHPAIKS